MSKECILPVVSLCVERSILKKTEQSETTLRHSAVRYSTFCGSLFKPDPETGPCFYPDILETQPFQDLAEFNLLLFDQFLKFLSDQKVGFDHAVFEIIFKDRVLDGRQ